MIAVPAVDLRQGRCVQLVGGRPEDERVSLPDPVKVADQWWRAGFRALHVVDLDAALGDGSNRQRVREVVEATGATVQVGGGIRSTEDVREVLALGADRVAVGTRAVEDPAWLRDVARAYPGRVMVAADVREGRILSRGWQHASELQVEAFLPSLEGLPLAGILCTDVGREGQVEGIDRESVRRVLVAGRHPVWISGGIRSMDELAFLEAEGAAGAVLGMALYTGVLKAEEVARAYGEDLGG